ncbi:Uncharacterised protein [Enterobacter cloacae]|nr:Uncharacterised protein [Enterobacter cloacae]
MRVHHARVVQVFDKLLQLFVRGGTVIHDNQFPVIVILTQDRFNRADRQLLTIPCRHIDRNQRALCAHVFLLPLTPALSPEGRG